jgi:hypothetical protein
VFNFAGFQPNNTMGRGVEKARVAFAAAENGAGKVERRLVRLRRCSGFARFQRGTTLSVASEGGGMANR